MALGEVWKEAPISPQKSSHQNTKEHNKKKIDVARNTYKQPKSHPNLNKLSHPKTTIQELKQFTWMNDVPSIRVAWHFTDGFSAFSNHSSDHVRRNQNSVTSDWMSWRLIVFACQFETSQFFFLVNPAWCSLLVYKIFNPTLNCFQFVVPYSTWKNAL